MSQLTYYGLDSAQRSAASQHNKNLEQICLSNILIHNLLSIQNTDLN